MHSNTDSPPRRLLLADDDNEVRLGVADLISSLGIEVIEADDIESALALARSGEVHAAILDMYMPGGTGLDLLPRLWELHAGLPCIVYSGRWSPSMEVDALQLGAHACLKKPVEPRRLRDEVLRAFGQDPQAN
ncbi:MAG: DNA-binding NtrC family response regulator [Planctomycetota bacterium]|jgi:DNA-binding NtrC family response regulator